METVDPYDLLLRGQSTDAMDMLRDDYSQNPGMREIVILGIAYIWIGKYEEAWDFLRVAIPGQRWSYDISFAMAGIAKWCMDDPVEAVRTWRKGIKTQYTDGAGGVTIPLLLYTASVLKPESIDRKEALALLDERVRIVIEHRKVKNCRIENWPGPLALYVLGKATRSELISAQESKWGTHRDDIVADCKWRTDFYDGVMELGRGNKEHFAELMAQMVNDVEQNTSDKKIFPSRLWTTEFFIARHELYRLHGKPDAGPRATGPIPPPPARNP